MTLPHPSPVGPQLKPCAAHESGVQFLPLPHKPGPGPPPHHWPEGQAPHTGVKPPQPLLPCPQLRPSWAQLSGTQLPPQTFGVPPPPQIWPPLQVPHEAVSPPQPLPSCPQFTPG